MTQEQKDLLLKDLCARLPYGVKIQTDYTDAKTLEGIQFPDYIGISDGYYSLDDMECKPYLFPLSSMTDVQKKKLKVMCDWHDDEEDAQSILVLFHEHCVMKSDVIDWLDENHFDYRGLIEKGLAIDATGLNIY